MYFVQEAQTNRGRPVFSGEECKLNVVNECVLEEATGVRLLLPSSPLYLSMWTIAKNKTNTNNCLTIISELSVPLSLTVIPKKQ